MTKLILSLVWASFAAPPRSVQRAGWRLSAQSQNWCRQSLCKSGLRAIMFLSCSPSCIEIQHARGNHFATPFDPFLRLNTLRDVIHSTTSMQISDEALVRAAQKGDLQAFLTLYDRYLPIVYNRVRYTIPQQDVEDVTQEVFFALMKSLNKFQGKSRFSTWVRSVVNHRVADYYRTRRPAEEQLDPELRSDGREHSSDERILMRNALNRLPERYREVLLLRFADGLQFGEVAEQMGLTLDAAKSLFRRAIVALRKEWEELNA